jgi:hypothetical protein
MKFTFQRTKEDVFVCLKKNVNFQLKHFQIWRLLFYGIWRRVFWQNDTQALEKPVVSIFKVDAFLPDYTSHIPEGSSIYFHRHDKLNATQF